jgi:hypothetical protein
VNILQSDQLYLIWNLFITESYKDIHMFNIFLCSILLTFFQKVNGEIVKHVHSEEDMILVLTIVTFLDAPEVSLAHRILTVFEKLTDILKTDNEIWNQCV